MRAIGQLPDQPNAKRFSDFLLVQGYPNQVEADEAGRWIVWIHEDEHIAPAQALLTEFLRQPADPKYRQAAPSARELREKEEKEEKAWRKRFFDRRTLKPGAHFRAGWMTAALAALCVAVALVKLMQGPDSPLIRALQITENPLAGLLGPGSGLTEVRHGQIWRVITPIFLHFGVFHLLFNMLWLLDLGGMIEGRQGAQRLLVKVLVLAAVSNLAQYAWAGPGFGGMSGVVYGLFGYVWLCGRLNPRSGFFIDPTSVTLMIVWFFLCMTGMMGPIANAAHGAGLGLGLLWGFLAAKLNRE